MPFLKHQIKLLNKNKMKKLGTTNFTCIYSMDVMCVNGMAQVKGGASNKDEGEWEVNYIDGNL